MTDLRRSYLALFAAAASLVAQPALASSHREAPGISKIPKVDGTDWYMFRSYEPGRNGYVTMLANYQGLQTPGGGPSYYTLDPNAVYEMLIDNDGDGKEDITFQFKFSNVLQNNDQGITLNVGGKTVAIPLRAAGPVSEANDPQPERAGKLYPDDDNGRPPYGRPYDGGQRQRWRNNLHQAAGQHRQQDRSPVRSLHQTLHLHRQYPGLRQDCPRLRRPAPPTPSPSTSARPSTW